MMIENLIVWGVLVVTIGVLAVVRPRMALKLVLSILVFFAATLLIAFAMEIPQLVAGDRGPRGPAPAAFIGGLILAVMAWRRIPNSGGLGAALLALWRRPTA